MTAEINPEEDKTETQNVKSLTNNRENDVPAAKAVPENAEPKAQKDGSAPKKPAMIRILSTKGTSSGKNNEAGASEILKENHKHLYNRKPTGNTNILKENNKNVQEITGSFSHELLKDNKIIYYNNHAINHVFLKELDRINKKTDKISNPYSLKLLFEKKGIISGPGKPNILTLLLDKYREFQPP